MLTPEPKRPIYKKKKRKSLAKSKDRDKWTKIDWINEAVWPIFSKFIRLRDCIATTGTATHGKCITCGRTYPFSKLQAGHFLPGRSDTVLFDEEAVNAQCYRCNVVLAGMWPAYYRAMQGRYGQDWVEEQITAWEDDSAELTLQEVRSFESLYRMQYERLMGR